MHIDEPVIPTVTTHVVRPPPSRTVLVPLVILSPTCGCPVYNRRVAAGPKRVRSPPPTHAPHHPHVPPRAAPPPLPPWHALVHSAVTPSCIDYANSRDAPGVYLQHCLADIAQERSAVGCQTSKNTGGCAQTHIISCNATPSST